MKKRLLSTLLALCMVLALLPSGTAFAEEFEPYSVGSDTEIAEDMEPDTEEDGVMPLTTVDDHTPPVVTWVTMNNPGGTVTVGDKLYFSISAEDESEIYMGWSELSFTFVCEQEHKHIIRADGYRGSYDEDTKQIKFELTITDDMLNGTYKLSSVSIYDIYHNGAHYYPADPDYPYDPGNPGNIDFDAVYFVIATPDIEPTDVSIPETLSLPVRTTQTIYPTVTPADSIPDWIWASADANIAEVAKVESGKACLITGVAPGTTTITGTTQNGLTAVCTVTVTDAPLPESGSIEESYQVGVGGFVDIEPVLTPEDATTLYEVTSDNPHVAGIALVNGGTAIRIQGNNPGTATITIRGANNLVMTTTVRVGKETDIQHEKMTVEGYPATCVRPGRTDSVRCSACWYEFTAAQEIPATGKHTWSEWRVVQAATATAAGSRERYCTFCGEHETQAIPATGSSTPSRPGTSGGSGGGSGGSSGSLSSPSSPGNVTSDGQNVQASVKDGTAEITNSDKNISDILDGAENGAIHIDASANKDVTEVSIPKGVVDAVAENETVSAVSITTSAGTVELHEEALNTISNAMTGSNDTISLEVKTIDADTIPSTQKYPIADVLNSAVFINLSATIQHRDASGRTTSTETIHEFGGSVTVSVPFELPANMEGRQIIACHIADDGSITYFPVKYENGVATFTTTHFSLFALVESRAAAFADINVSAWYMPSVEYVLNRGLMGDAGNQRFDPNGTTTRGMIMTILARLDGVDTSGSGPWYQKGMEWAVQAGVSDGTNPGGSITREELAVMLWRYADEPTVTGSLTSYPDAGNVHDWADTAMVWAVQNGIITGSDGKLNPRGNATRVQAAAMLTRFCQNIEK